MNGRSYRPIREVELLDIESGDVISTYPSIAAACRATNVYWASAWKCCNGLRNEAGGFKWRFKDELGRDENDGNILYYTLYIIHFILYYMKIIILLLI